MIRRFLAEERGDIAPVTYLLALIPALIFIFFSLDVGLRQGMRLSVEYAAFCAARAAATQIPRGDEQGACLTTDKEAAVLRAATACLTPVAGKMGLAPAGGPFPLGRLIGRMEQRGMVRIAVGHGPGFHGHCPGGGEQFDHNEIINITVIFQPDVHVPLSPLNWACPVPCEIRATTTAMLHTIR